MSAPPRPAIDIAPHLPVLELPLDRPRPAVPGFDVRQTERTLDNGLLPALRAASAQAGSSLFAGLLGAFVATLYRLTGQDDIAVGIPVNSPPATALLPVRIATQGQLRFDALVAECQVALSDALEAPHSSASVRFQLDPALDDRPVSTQGTPPPAFETVELTLTLRPLHGRLVAEARYNAALFDEASVQRWLEMFECVARSAAHDPTQVIGRLDVLSPDAARTLLALQPPRTALVGAPFAHAGFMVRAARDPTQPAVQDGAQRCSYGELHALSNRLAHVLRERGVGRGQRVGLCLARGIDMLVALLAVLKSGAAYVPLDPSFPQARLDYYAQDARLGVLLTTSDMATAPRAWCADAATRLFELDREPGWRGACPDPLAPSPLDALPDDAAYVIYTSGSTGKPKGVCVQHRAVANLLQSMQQAPGIGPGDRLAAVTTLSFDMAVPELLLPLAAGAQIVLVQRDTAMDGLRLRALLDAERITVLQAAPGMWQLLLEAQWQGRLDENGPGPGLRGWIGAEPVRGHLALALLARCTELWNLYGPTETTVWSTAWRMQPDVIAASGVSIGQPIANTDVWILDAALQPCPQGVPGEICIGGHGVTLGYLARPELTAERFVQVNILGTATQVYRTGDRGRWRNDGLLEHLGRLDFQVKVRGYRIEPGEIEARCNEHAGVSRSVVVAREDHPGDVRLVAYLTLVPGATLERRALAQHLRERLPAYMVPQHVVTLAALPTLPNGKIDRAALPPPQAVPRDVQAGTDIATDIAIDTVPAPLPHAPLDCRFDRPSAPLTPSQERIRLMEEQHPGRAFHNMPCARRLLGALDVAHLEDALREVIRRQPALRTCLGVDPRSGLHVQSIAPHVAFSLPLTDLRGLPMDQREAELADRMQALADRPIDMHRAPMAHAALFQLDDNEHAFVFVPHQLVWDDGSFALLQRELAALFEATSSSGNAGSQPLPAIATTHGDHAEWLTRSMTEPAFKEQLGFWRNRAVGVPPLPPPHTDMPRRAGRHGQGGTQPIDIDLATTQRLRGVAHGLDVTLGMLAFGIYALTLGQVTGTGALAIAHPVRGRQQPETEGVMGRFDHLLPVALTLDMQQPLARFLRGVKNELHLLAHHPHAPTERLAAPCHWNFSFRDASHDTGRLGALRSHPMHLMQRGATEDIALRLVERPHGLQGALVCNTGLYLRETGARLRERYLELLRRAADQPDATLASIASTEGSASATYLLKLLATAPAEITDAAQPLPLPTTHLARPGEAPLAQIWADVIRIDVRDIRASDNFFELGGDSLLAQRAVQQTALQLGYRVEPQRYLFETLGQIAASSMAQTTHAPPSHNLSVKPAGLLARAFGGWLRKG
ncbi:amino acid adenylation domain-containing protein [Variovorax sp. H27-G14]|uniref:amino acid adenylation domain-containing protein n=1 Tax=Variovorax sp. H27-G14 TaxID=3111914 RepID=UPI0038FC9284